MLERLKKHIVNIPGKRLGKKLLVFESDDWGSLRIPDAKAFDTMVTDGLISANDPFSKYDALETRDDLHALFTVLKKYKDKKGNHPVFTANMVMANPDFDKIKVSFDEQVQSGKVSSETAALFNTLIMLFNIILSISMENTTKKTSSNSSIPPYALAYCFGALGK